ncbi:MAG: RNA polymerase sigma factor [Rhizomicrobium sp.]
MPDAAAEARVDQALVARILLTGDQRAFEQLVRRHQGTVRAQLRRLLSGDEAQADDLAQEAFLLAWRKLDQFRGEARFSTWLYRIAYTCYLQARRTKAWPPDHVREVESRLVPPHASDLRLDVRRAMQRLSPAEQTVLLHCVPLGLSHEETAYVLEMPLGTVKSHAARGKAKLRTWLAAWDEVTGKERSA